MYNTVVRTESGDSGPPTRHFLFSAAQAGPRSGIYRNCARVNEVLSSVVGGQEQLNVNVLEALLRLVYSYRR